MAVFDEFIAYLGRYHQLSVALKEYLQASVVIKTLPRNHTLLHEGEVPKAIWFIGTGLARVHRFDDSSQNDLTLWYWGSELIMPFDGILCQKPSDTSISLLQRSSVVSLSYIHLKYLNKLFPEYHLIGQTLLEHINQKLSRHLDLIQHEESAARYQFLMDHYSNILRYASLRDVASFLGMSISTIKHLRYK